MFIQLRISKVYLSLFPRLQFLFFVIVQFTLVRCVAKGKWTSVTLSLGLSITIKLETKAILGWSEKYPCQEDVFMGSILTKPQYLITLSSLSAFFRMLKAVYLLVNMFLPEKTIWHTVTICLLLGTLARGSIPISLWRIIFLTFVAHHSTICITYVRSGGISPISQQSHSFMPSYQVVLTIVTVYCTVCQTAH